MRKRLFPYLLLAPTFLFLVGMDNFIRLFQDPVFWLSLRNNGVYILLTVIPGI